jgi:hypothetical protein
MVPSSVANTAETATRRTTLASGQRTSLFRAYLSRVRQPTLVTQRLVLIPLSDEHLEFEGSTAARYSGHTRRRLAAAREIPGLGYWAGFDGEQFVGLWLLQPPHGPDQPEVPGEADLGYRVRANPDCALIGLRRWARPDRPARPARL